VFYQEQKQDCSRQHTFNYLIYKPRISACLCVWHFDFWDDLHSLLGGLEPWKTNKISLIIELSCLSEMPESAMGSRKASDVIVPLCCGTLSQAVVFLVVLVLSGLVQWWKKHKSAYYCCLDWLFPQLSGTACVWRWMKGQNGLYNPGRYLLILVL